MDIEASGLHSDSYPIEVGIILSSGDAYCSLIKPAKGWTYWSEKAEEIHGISREELERHGKSPTEVAGQLNNLLKHGEVYSDCWVLDYPWLIKLYEQAALEQTFTLRDMTHLIDDESLQKLHESKQSIFNELKLTRHRATNDARILQIAYQQLTESKTSK